MTARNSSAHCILRASKDAGTQCTALPAPVAAGLSTKSPRLAAFPGVLHHRRDPGQLLVPREQLTRDEELPDGSLMRVMRGARLWSGQAIFRSARAAQGRAAYRDRTQFSHMEAAFYCSLERY